MAIIKITHRYPQRQADLIETITAKDNEIEVEFPATQLRHNSTCFFLEISTISKKFRIQGRYRPFTVYCAIEKGFLTRARRPSMTTDCEWPLPAIVICPRPDENFLRNVHSRRSLKQRASIKPRKHSHQLQVRSGSRVFHHCQAET